MRRIVDPELAQWPIEEEDRRRIKDRRISMFGRTNWAGYPRGFPPFGRTGFFIFLTVVQPIACVLVIVGLLLAGSPNSAFAFGMTFIAQALILVIVLRGRRRSLLRAAAAELGHPLCLICGFYNQGHRQQFPCSECGAVMPDLPDEFFPPVEVEVDDQIAALKSQRRRSPPLRFGKS